MAMMSRASGIIKKLKKKSRDVRGLMRELKTPITKYRRRVIRKLLRHKFEAALAPLEETIPAGMMMYLASVFARNTVADVHFEVAKRADSIVVSFLCATVMALHSLRKMVTSGIMAADFTGIINSQAATPRTVHVYVRDEDFNLTLSVLSSAQGWLFDKHLLIFQVAQLQQRDRATLAQLQVANR